MALNVPVLEFSEKYGIFVPILCNFSHFRTNGTNGHPRDYIWGGERWSLNPLKHIFEGFPSSVSGLAKDLLFIAYVLTNFLMCRLVRLVSIEKSKKMR